MFTIVAHRGFSEKLPENTFPSFDLAIRLGFHNFEFDVQLTKDKIPVIIHDSNLFRTTGIEGLVSENNYDEIKLLEAKNKFNVAGEDYKIPRLNDLLEKYQYKANLHLELKSRDHKLSEIVYKCLSDYGWLSREKGLYELGGITISSFFIEQLIKFERYTQSERTAWLLENITENDLENCVKQNINVICPRAKFSNSESVDMARNKNIMVRNWGVSNEDDLIKAYNSGSTGSTVDWPLKAKKILKKYQKKNNLH